MANGANGAHAGGAADDAEAPLLGLDSEQWEWEAVPDLDAFFTRIYQ